MKWYRSAASALSRLGIEQNSSLDAVERRFPVLVNDYYLGLIDRELGSDDPIYRQCLPSAEELNDQDADFDPLAENAQMPVPNLIHRFADRVVLLTTGNCAVRCRFCFRKRTWATDGDRLQNINDKLLNGALAYLRERPEIREVLVSGGDPLMLPIRRLFHILEAISAIPSIDILRLGTRVPVTWPQRITPALARRLAGIRGLWLMTHFNHPRELTPESEASLTLLVRAGVPVLNQTVLLKGVNDTAEVLETLFRRLVSLRVKPHYLFHVDPVRGVRHFATGLTCGLNIMRRFRSRLSSLAVPTFAIDLPNGGGKVALQPNYQCGNSFLDIHNRTWIPYPDAATETEKNREELR